MREERYSVVECMLSHIAFLSLQFQDNFLEFGFKSLQRVCQLCLLRSSTWQNVRIKLLQNWSKVSIQSNNCDKKWKTLRYRPSWYGFFTKAAHCNDLWVIKQCWWGWYVGYKGVMIKVYKTWDGIPEGEKNHLEDRTHSLPNLCYISLLERLEYHQCWRRSI